MTKIISKKLVGKFLELIRKLHKESVSEWEKYRQDLISGTANTTAVPNTTFDKFWQHFAKNLKVGQIEGVEYIYMFITLRLLLFVFVFPFVSLFVFLFVFAFLFVLLLIFILFVFLLFDYKDR